MGHLVVWTVRGVAKAAAAVFWHPGYTLIVLMYLRDNVVIDPRGQKLVLLGIELFAVMFVVLCMASGATRAVSPYTHKVAPDGTWERITRTQGQPSIRGRIRNKGEYAQIKVRKGGPLTPADHAALRALHWRNRLAARVERKVRAREQAEIAQLGMATPRSKWERWATSALPTEKAKKSKTQRKSERSDKAYEKALKKAKA